MKTNCAFLVGGTASNTADFYSDVNNQFRRFSDIMISEGTITSINAIDRNTKTKEVIFGGTDLLTNWKQGIRTSLWTASGLTVSDIVEVIKYGNDVYGSKMLIGVTAYNGSYIKLLKYEDGVFTDLTANLTGWVDGHIFSIGFNGTSWMIGGVSAGADIKLFEFNGNTGYADFSADAAAAGLSGNLQSIEWDGATLWILGTATELWNFDGVITYDEVGTDEGSITRIYYDAKHGYALVGGGSKYFKKFIIGSGLVDLSSSLIGFDAGETITTILPHKDGFIIAGNLGACNYFDGTNFKDIKASLKDLSGIPILNGIGWEGAM